MHQMRAAKTTRKEAPPTDAMMMIISIPWRAQKQQLSVYNFFQSWAMLTQSTNSINIQMFVSYQRWNSQPEIGWNGVTWYELESAVPAKQTQMTPILARSDGPHIKILAVVNLTSICHILKSCVMQIWKTYSLYHMSLIWFPYMSLILVWYMSGILQYLLPLICPEYVTYLSNVWRKYWLHISWSYMSHMICGSNRLTNSPGRDRW